MAVGCKLPLVLCQVDFSIGHFTKGQLAASEERAKEWERMWTKSQIFNFISEVIAPTFTIFYLKQVIRSSLYTKGRNYIRVERQKSGIILDIACLPQVFTLMVDVYKFYIHPAVVLLMLAIIRQWLPSRVPKVIAGWWRCWVWRLHHRVMWRRRLTRFILTRMNLQLGVLAWLD